MHSYKIKKEHNNDNPNMKQIMFYLNRRKRPERQMPQTEMATGCKDTLSDVMEQMGPSATCLTPTPVEPTYENVRESEVYEEVL